MTRPDVNRYRTGGVDRDFSLAMNEKVATVVARYRRLFFPYPPHVRLHARFDYLQRHGGHNRGTPQMGLRVLAPSGSGKTKAAETYCNAVNARRPPNDRFGPVVMVRLEKNTTIRRLMASILSKFGDDHADIGTEDSLRRRVLTCFKHFKSELLILDEVQHLTHRSTATQYVTDSLKTFLDSGTLPIVFLGTEEAIGMFRDNLQLNGRMLPPEDLAPLKWPVRSDRTLFAGYVEKLVTSMFEGRMLPQISEDLRDQWVIGCLHQFARGIVGRVSRLLEVALEIALRRDAAEVEAFDLALAIDEWAIPLGFTKTNPFREQGS